MEIGLASWGGRAASATSLLLLMNTLGISEPKAPRGDGFFITESNDATSNQLLVYSRSHDGTLAWSEAVSTGGAGNGGGLGQGAIAFEPDQRLLFAANAGSNSVSAFVVGADGPQLLGTTPSQGTTPVSITVHEDVVYVLNAGGTANIAGFKWSWISGLQPIGGDVRGLSTTSPSPEQVGFDSRGESLVVSEKGTNSIDLFPVDRVGIAGLRTTVPSVGTAPFGFGFGHSDVLFMSNAAGGSGGTSTASSYRLRGDGIDVISGAVPTNEMAACWAVVTHDGRFGYVADAGSATITGFGLHPHGDLTPLSANGLTASTDAHPIDMAVTPGDRFLYAVASTGGAIDEFRIGPEGSLTPLGSISGLPTSISGAVTG